MKRTLGGLLLVASLIFGVAAMLAGSAEARSAPRWYCSTTTTQGEACIPDPTTTHVTYPSTTKATTTTMATTTSEATTTSASTTIATTTTGSTTSTTRPTTTVPVTNPCPGSGCPTTTATSSTTSTTAATTTAPSTTEAPTTTVTTTATTAAPSTTQPKELPHTGSMSGPLLGGSALLLALGCLFCSLGSTDDRRLHGFPWESSRRG